MAQTTQTRVGQQVGLRPLLMGAPLSARGGDAGPIVDNAINYHLDKVRTFMRAVYGESACERIDDELQNVIDFPNDQAAAAACKRALLLYAIKCEHEIGDYFAAQEQAVDAPPLAKTLTERVLPILVPRFIDNCFEHPDAFVDAATSMAVMFGQDLGSRRPSQGDDGDDDGDDDGEARTLMPPPPVRIKEQIANAELPPPLGSTATKIDST